MSNHFKSNIRKSLTLAMVACLGTSIVLEWPDIQRAYGQATATNAVPPALPILPASEAQQKLPFHLLMPDALPTGAQFEGVQLVPIVNANEDAVIAHVRQMQMPYTGYGMLYRVRNGKYLIRAWQNSPAQKAGLPSTEEVNLLAIDGHPTVFGQGTIARENLPLVTALLHTPPPLAITYKTSDGTVQTVTLSHPGTFMEGAEYPIEEHGYVANLVYNLQDKEFDITEQAAPPGETTYPTTSMTVKMNGKDVWFSNNSLVTSAFWTQAGLAIGVNNRRSALNQQELAALINAI